MKNRSKLILCLSVMCLLVVCLSLMAVDYLANSVVISREMNHKPVVREGMVRVPAGEFVMGSDEAPEEWMKPAHQVYLDAFWIDQHQVTVDKYRACVNAGRCIGDLRCMDHGGLVDKTENNWLKPEKKNHPINCVTWEQAKTYCAWEGKGLPTEAQWEKAARGTDSRTYPWGEKEPSCELAQVMNCGNQTAEVGSKPKGASPYGVFDMAGNLWEWTADWYSEYEEPSPYSITISTNPTGAKEEYSRVLRGGSFIETSSRQRADFRTSCNPKKASYLLGFRCAKSAEPTSRD